MSKYYLIGVTTFEGDEEDTILLDQANYDIITKLDGQHSPVFIIDEKELASCPLLRPEDIFMRWNEEEGLFDEAETLKEHLENKKAEDTGKSEGSSDE